MGEDSEVTAFGIWRTYNDGNPIYEPKNDGEYMLQSKFHNLNLENLRKWYKKQEPKEIEGETARKE